MNFLKKQGVAWAITIVMILISIGIGRANADPIPVTPSPEPAQTTAPLADNFYVRDDADILSPSAERELSDLNRKMYNSMEVVVACVTCEDGRSDIYDLALDWGRELELYEYDFILVVDMESQQYILVQGAGLTGMISDAQCDRLADQYMEGHLTDGRYDEAFLSMVEYLYDWYRDHY